VLINSPLIHPKTQIKIKQKSYTQTKTKIHTKLSTPKSAKIKQNKHLSTLSTALTTITGLIYIKYYNITVI